MNNSKTNFYDFQSRDYIDWLLSLIKRQPLQMITEKTYEDIIKSNSDIDKRNLLDLGKFTISLNNYAIENHIKTNMVDSSDLEYTIHFSLVLKIDDIFLLIESVSSTFKSYTFISTLNNYNEESYIDWDLYSENKPN